MEMEIGGGDGGWRESSVRFKFLSGSNLKQKIWREVKDKAGSKRYGGKKDTAGRERCPKQKIWREKRYGEGKDMAGKKIRRMKRYGGKIQL